MGELLRRLWGLISGGDKEKEQSPEEILATGGKMSDDELIKLYDKSSGELYDKE